MYYLPYYKKRAVCAPYFLNRAMLYIQPRTARLFNTKVTLINPEDLKAKWVNHKKRYYCAAYC